MPFLKVDSEYITFLHDDPREFQKHFFSYDQVVDNFSLTYNTILYDYELDELAEYYNDRLKLSGDEYGGITCVPALINRKEESGETMKVPCMVYAARSKGSNKDLHILDGNIVIGSCRYFFEYQSSKRLIDDIGTWEKVIVDARDVSDFMLKQGKFSKS